MPAVLFDFNGVIADDEGLHFEAFRAVLAPRGIDVDRARYDEELLGFDDLGVARHLFPKETPAQHAAFVAEKGAAYDALTVNGVPAFAGACELVRALAAEGVRLAIVSGALRGEIERILAGHGIRACFEVVVAAEDVTHCKPHPEGYTLGLARLGLPSARGVAIEDSPAGIRAAREAGLRVIGVAHSAPLNAISHAHLAVAHIRELSAERVLNMVD